MEQPLYDQSGYKRQIVADGLSGAFHQAYTKCRTEGWLPSQYGCQRLEFRITWTLVREELIGQPFLTKALVSINSQRLEIGTTRYTTLHTNLAQLVE